MRAPPRPSTISCCTAPTPGASPLLTVQITPYPVAGTTPRHLLLTLRERGPEVGAQARRGHEVGLLARERVPGMLYRRRNDAAWTVELSDGQIGAILGTDGQPEAGTPLALLELVHPDDRNHAARPSRRLCRRMPISRSSIACAAHGRYRYVRDRAPVRDVNGGAVGAEGLDRGHHGARG